RTSAIGSNRLALSIKRHRRTRWRRPRNHRTLNDARRRLSHVDARARTDETLTNRDDGGSRSRGPEPSELLLGNPHPVASDWLRTGKHTLRNGRHATPHIAVHV